MTKEAAVTQAFLITAQGRGREGGAHLTTSQLYQSGFLSLIGMFFCLFPPRRSAASDCPSLAVLDVVSVEVLRRKTQAS